MLARLAALLLVLNLAWLAWSQGWLQPFGLGPAAPTEAARLQRQLHPEALRVEAPSSVPPEAPAASIAAAASAASMEPAPAAAQAPAPAMSDAASSTTSTAAPAAAEAALADAASAPARSAPAASAPARSALAASAPASSATAAAAPAGADTRCLQAGVFDARQAEALRGTLAALPAGSWRFDEVRLTGRWMVYLGDLPDAAAVAARRVQLRAQGIDTDRPGTALEPGLSLGRFASQTAAERARAELAAQGVDGVQVVPEPRERPAYRLRLPQVDAALAEQLGPLRRALGGRVLRDCAEPEQEVRRDQEVER